jgi:hypothetical protein
MAMAHLISLVFTGCCFVFSMIIQQVYSQKILRAKLNKITWLPEPPVTLKCQQHKSLRQEKDLVPTILETAK